MNSQTAGAELLLRYIGVKAGDEVITSAYTYTATASVICHLGAKPVLVDVEKDSVRFNLAALKRAITEKTKVIIPVDIAGRTENYDEIFKIAEEKKDIFCPSSDVQRLFGRIIILADTAHSLGASYKGKRAGNIADFSSFSFHAVKNLTTAEGGAVTLNDKSPVSADEFYKTVKLFSLHGQTKDAFTKKDAGKWEYDVIAPLYKCNMTDISAALGLSQLKRYDKTLARRREIVGKYDKAFLPRGIVTLNHFEDGRESSCHLYLTRIPNISPVERNEIIEEMGRLGVKRMPLQWPP